MLDRESGGVEEESGWPWWLWVFAALSGLAATLFFYELFTMWYPALSNWGDDGRTGNEAGDAMGPFASLFSALALMAAFITINLQRKELRETRNEMEKQTSLLAKQGFAADAQAQAARAQATAAESASFEIFRQICHAMWAGAAFARAGVDRVVTVRGWTLPDLPLCRHPYILQLAIGVRDAVMSAVRAASAEYRSDGNSDQALGERIDEFRERLEAFHSGVRIWYRASIEGRALSELEQEVMKKLLSNDSPARGEGQKVVDDLLAARGAFDLEP